MLITISNVSDQALVRAGVQIKEENEMVEMKVKGKLRRPNRNILM